MVTWWERTKHPIHQLWRVSNDNGATFGPITKSVIQIHSKRQEFPLAICTFTLLFLDKLPSNYPEKCLRFSFEDFETNIQMAILKRITAMDLSSSELILYSDHAPTENQQIHWD
jgi:hypothetical protein